MRKWILVLLGSLLLSVAHGQEVRRAIAVGGQPAADNDLARFLAGLPVDPASPLSSLQAGRAYAAHTDALGRLWRRYNEHYFSPMRLWSAIELAPRIPQRIPVLYFFGGPDAINAMALYPDAPVYILGGLEPVGAIPNPTTLDPAAIEQGLQNLEKSVEVVLSYGHFITKDMKAEFEKSVFQGVMPVLYTFIALSGGEVIQGSYIGIGPGGALQELGTNYGGAKGLKPGIRIVFRKGANAVPQTLYYVQANLADDALRDRSVLQWVSGFGKPNVYLKAASYLMHESSFSTIRSFLLDDAVSILQDDSGIPLRYFDGGRWRLYFFGRYSGVLDIFTKYHQPALQSAFQTAGAGELPFGTGYKWRKGESNLTLAVGQAPPRAEAVGVPAGSPQ